MSLFFALSILSLTVSAGPGPVPAIPDPSVFAILPWGPNDCSLEAYQSMRDAGFNLAGFVPPDNLDNVQKAGLKAFVQTNETLVDDAMNNLTPDEVNKRVKALFDRVGHHPANFGYVLRDEPPAYMFESLRRWADDYHALNNDATTYINLLPTYASTGMLARPSYREYLDDYVKIVAPRYLSVDHYCLMKGLEFRSGYYENLQAVWEAGQRYHLPIWNIGLSNQHYGYADPTDTTFRFWTYSTLAYGCRGIGYFTYLKLTDWINDAPLDATQHKTATWDRQRAANYALLRLLPTYLKYKSINVYHLGDVPGGCRGVDSAQSGLKVTGADGTNLLVGEFSAEDGSRAVIVFNKNLKANAAYTVSAANGSLSVISPRDGGARPFAGRGELLPAGGAFIVWKP